MSEDTDSYLVLCLAIASGRFPHALLQSPVENFSLFLCSPPSAENRMRQQNMFLFDFKWGLRRDGIDAKSVPFRLMTFRVAAEASWNAVSKTFVFDAATACANERFSATNRLLANERDDSDILF
ncbi:hypothetical protein [Methylocystis sp.]|uniref:hypothetical protein n=1 Tax=Methylocystis sp. TaxID=1911079 RepID=UPI0025D6815C|nr:hypothetical protein [Methylocystis sp.]